jgi:hypothetical protein
MRESGLPSFPEDFPDTMSYSVYQTKKSEQVQVLYFFFVVVVLSEICCSVFRPLQTFSSDRHPNE